MATKKSFLVLPVTRLPSDRRSIGNEQSEFDAEDTDIFFQTFERVVSVGEFDGGLGGMI